MIFDPSTKIINLSLNWTRTLLTFIIIPTYYWIIPSRQIILINITYKILHKEFKTLIGLNYFNGSTFIFVIIFIYIFINNFLGLYPYIFTATSHIAINLSLTLPLWISFITFGWLNHTQHIFTHLVPQGTPIALISFIVIIETIRNIIRPRTLAVRLIANIIAGHLLITLLSNLYSSIPSFIIFIISSVIFLLLTLEASVTLIQAYVFSILSVLYSNEVI